jgi:site-specific recombinase XerD
MTELPRFRSILAEPIEQFIAYKRALGRRFATEDRQLLLFDRFLFERDVDTLGAITPELVKSFLRSRPRKVPKSYNDLLGVVRRLFDWMVLQEIVDHSPVEARPRKEGASRTPVILDPASVRALLNQAAALPDRPRAPLRGRTYRMAFALMYALGLRVGEASRIQVGDLDFERKTLLIRNSKFGKSRVLPFGERLAFELREFLSLRRGKGAKLVPESPLLSFNGRTAVSANRISSTFQLLMPHLGFSDRRQQTAPRAHDLRHSFAVGTLLRWYREGTAPADRLLYLSTFLGHAGIHSTAVYLTITSDLLEEANQRFEPYAASVLARGTQS